VNGRDSSLFSGLLDRLFPSRVRLRDYFAETCPGGGIHEPEAYYGQTLVVYDGFACVKCGAETP
jgi:hypothetical protein